MNHDSGVALSFVVLASALFGCGTTPEPKPPSASPEQERIRVALKDFDMVRAESQLLRALFWLGMDNFFSRHYESLLARGEPESKALESIHGLVDLYDVADLGTLEPFQRDSIQELRSYERSLIDEKGFLNFPPICVSVSC